jgi:hypothetical protein
VGEVGEGEAAICWMSRDGEEVEKDAGSGG